MSALTLKESGNDAFKAGDFDEAIDKYTKAIEVSKKDEVKDLAVLYKNRAAVYLKLEEFDRAIQDCDKSLDLVNLA